MKKQIEIKCRRGVTYSIEAHGNNGSIYRLRKMLEDCCCYVCHNHDCYIAIEGKQKCENQCELYTKTPYCEPKGGGDEND